MSFLQLAWHLSGLAVLVICLPLNALVPITTCILNIILTNPALLDWNGCQSRRGKICIICYECSWFLQNMIFSTRFGTSWTDTRHGRWSKRTQGWTLSMRSSMGSRYKSSLKTQRRKKKTKVKDVPNKVLKMYAWEQPFMEMIGDIRQDSDWIPTRRRFSIVDPPSFNKNQVQEGRDNCFETVPVLGRHSGDLTQS